MSRIIQQGERGRDGLDGRKGEPVSKNKPVKLTKLTKFCIMTSVKHSQPETEGQGSREGNRAEHRIIKIKG